MVLGSNRRWLAVSCLAAICHLLSAICYAASWPNFRRDEARTGFVREGIAPDFIKGEDDKEWRWSFDIPGQVLSSPVVAYDRVYIGARSGSVYCLDAYTGQVLWDYSTDGWVDATPAVADGRVFVPSRDGSLYAFDALTGQVLWVYSTGSTNLSSPVVLNGEVYFATGYPSKTLHVLDAKTGAVRRSTTLTQFTASSPTLDKTSGIVFLGTSDGKYNAWNLDLTPHWKDGPVQTRGKIFFATPALADGKLLAIAGDWDQKLHAFQIADGVDSPSWSETPPLVSVSTEVSLAASVAVTADTVYVGSACEPHCLFALTLSTGGLRWKIPLGTGSKFGVASSPAVANNMLYLLSPQGELYAVHTGTGGVQARINLGGKGLSSPAVANGWVYAATMSGKLYAFESQRTWSLSSPDSLLEVVEGTVSVKGTVRSPYLQSYTLEYGRGTDPAIWTTLATGTQAVVRGILASWDTNELEVDKDNNVYTLKLEVVESGASVDISTVAYYTFSVPQVKTASVDPSTDVTLRLSDGTEIFIPAGAVAGNDTLTVKKLFSGYDGEFTGIPEGVVASNIVREFKLASSEHPTFLKPVTLKLPYHTYSAKKPKNLRIYFYDDDPSVGEWRIVNTSKVKEDEKRVWADVDHFTLFRIMEYAPTGVLLEAAKVYTYPNPARGNSLKFKFRVDEDADVTVKVYDVAGDLVAELQKPGVIGGTIRTLDWDISGKASGIYIYRLEVATLSGKKASVTKKLAIIH